jgi:hypothetical protein
MPDTNPSYVIPQPLASLNYSTLDRLAVVSVTPTNATLDDLLPTNQQAKKRKIPKLSASVLGQGDAWISLCVEGLKRNLIGAAQAACPILFLCLMLL